ncbi:MAG TPA: hypothetical protein VH497_07670 [Vicinamibacterales bacterium]|jgi:hypothetical protein
MRREHLLALFPPRWRERYGEEFLATVEDGRLGLRDTIDIMFAAFDAWISADVRRATISTAGTDAGGRMSINSLLACRREAAAVTPRDALIGAAVMLAGSLLFKTLAYASRDTLPAATHVLTDLAFLGPFTLSMPFWLMKGQPWKAQAAIVGGTLAILTLIG